MLDVLDSTFLRKMHSHTCVSMSVCYCSCPCFVHDNRKTGNEELVLTIRQMLDNQKKDIRSMLEEQAKDIKLMIGQQTITKETEEIKAKEDTKQIAVEYSEAKDEHGCYARCA